MCAATELPRRHHHHQPGRWRPVRAWQAASHQPHHPPAQPARPAHTAHVAASVLPQHQLQLRWRPRPATLPLTSPASACGSAGVEAAAAVYSHCWSEVRLLHPPPPQPHRSKVGGGLVPPPPPVADLKMLYSELSPDLATTLTPHITSPHTSAGQLWHRYKMILQPYPSHWRINYVTRYAKALAKILQAACRWLTLQTRVHVYCLLTVFILPFSIVSFCLID